MYGQMTRREKWEEFCSSLGYESGFFFSEERFAKAFYWIKQHYFSLLTTFLSGGKECNGASREQWR